MNIDNTTMPNGAQFIVQYFLNPDDTHFVHVVTKENLIKARSYIDNPLLNGNPKAQFQYFQSASPNVRGGMINKDEIQTQYDETAGKWFITKTNGKVLDLSTGYSISISPGLNTLSHPVIAAPVTTSSPVLHSMSGIGDAVFITVTGNQQGQFTGTYEMNKIELINFEMGVSSPIDINSGLSTGKHHYSPILIQKKTDASSIQFFQAVASNEILGTVTFDIYKKASGGTAALDYSIVLNNASISNFTQLYNQTANASKTDSISIIFQSIKYSRGTVIVSDNSKSEN
ncbi:MAG: type VI secretion system tube protein Hcp [Chitinophagaceae bacterium]